MLTLLLLVGMISGAGAQELEVIKLNQPDKKRGLSVMQALEKRQSTRQYADKQLDMQDLSDLLWAANGINRPESGKRTAPSALNAQDVDVYVCFPEGAYLYDAKSNVLQPIAKGDFRLMVADSQEFAKEAPVCLVLVSDLNRFKRENKESMLLMGAVDVGIVSQNISLFCAATGLATVPRGYMNKDELKMALKLKESQHLLINHPVGYTK